MPVILPYDENLVESEGAFIDNDGTILYTGLQSHMNVAIDYLLGNDYYSLLDMKYENNIEEFKCYIKYINLQYDEKLGIDEFLSSKLNKKQQELFKKWKDTFEFERFDFYTDFMVDILGIDKFSPIYKKISTIKNTPYIYYYNYILMGFNIDKRYPVKLNDDGFFEEYSNVSQIELIQDRKYQDEALEIISKVPIKDRKLFFK